MLFANAVPFDQAASVSFSVLTFFSAIGLALLLRNQPVKPSWYVIKFIGTVAITLTGVVFTFVLAPTFRQGAWNLQNTLTHVVGPVVSVIDFFVTGKQIDPVL